MRIDRGQRYGDPFSLGVNCCLVLALLFALTGQTVRRKPYLLSIDAWVREAPEEAEMKRRHRDLRVLCHLFLEALDEQENRAKPSRDEKVVIKGYMIDSDETVEPSVIDLLRELHRRARHAA